MPLHDVHYQHWDGAHLGLWTRRWVVAKNGLTACLRNKFTRNVVIASWLLAVVMAGVLFVVGQLLVPGSLVMQWVGTFNKNLQVFANFLINWLTEHPEISVRTTQDVLFFFFGTILMPFSIFIMGMAVPFLITRDLASNAIIIYSSKAITRGDYLLGKFCAAFGLLVLIWLAPACLAWFLGNLLAPNWSFFWHARMPLAHLLVYGLSSMVVLSVIALGVSSVSATDKTTVPIWFLWWVLGWPLADIANHTKPWLAFLSFSYDIRQIAVAVFGLGKDIQIAQDNIPLLGGMLRNNIRPETMAGLNSPPIGGALVALAVMLAVSAVIIHKRVKP